MLCSSSRNLGGNLMWKLQLVPTIIWQNNNSSKDFHNDFLRSKKTKNGFMKMVLLDSSTDEKLGRSIWKRAFICPFQTLHHPIGLHLHKSKIAFGSKILKIRLSQSFIHKILLESLYPSDRNHGGNLVWKLRLDPTKAWPNFISSKDFHKDFLR